MTERPTAIRKPRLAEMVAATLRSRIVDGDIPDGGLLPPLEKLVQEFQVSPPSVREALRILENERLITVRRGNVGGAVVHRPRAEAVAYMLGLVLQSQRTGTADLRAALGGLQPLCAGLCASRRDRKRLVVPKLRATCDGMAASIDDVPAFERWSRQFHGDLIQQCGNETLVLVVGSLEELWSAQSEAWSYRVAVADESPDPELRKQGLLAHELITAAIDGGDVGRAEQLVRDHMSDPQIFTPRARGPAIQATSLREV